MGMPNRADEPSPAAGVRKLARPLGQATRRRLRVFGTLPASEMLAVCYRLRRRIAEWRPTLDAPAPFNIWSYDSSHRCRPCHFPPFLCALSHSKQRLRVFRTLPEWEVAAVCHSLRRLIAERRAGQALTQARMVEWARELDYALGDGRFRAECKASTLDNRVEALACPLLAERGEPTFHRRARPAAW